MFETLRSSFRDFAHSEPGHRFEDRYLRVRHADRGIAHRALLTGLGVLVFAAGVVMLIAPGPGLLGMLAGASLIAQESQVLSRRLDRGELWLRRSWTQLRAFWRRKASPGTKLLLVVAAMCILGGAAFGAVEIVQHFT
ncbi:MAG: PGPGW domain-containing protein [Pseudomonadota bacterium]